MPGDKLAAILSEQVKANTGRELTLSGDVNLSFWPVLGMETGPVTFGNAPWAGPEPMLSADSLAVGVDAAALLAGDLKIKRVFAQNPVLRLELSEGRGNWVMGAAETTPSAGATGGAPSGETGAVTLERLELTDARLIYVENGVTQMDFAGVTLSASWPDVSAPMVMQASMAVPGGAVQVDLKLPDLPAFSSGAVTPLDVALTAPGGEIGFNGNVNLSGEMDGKMQVITQSTEKMLTAFGQGGVAVPHGLGRTANISGQMTYTKDGRVSLRNMVAQLDDNRLVGEADITIADPPQIVARLNTDALDLSRVTDAEPGSGGEFWGNSHLYRTVGPRHPLMRRRCHWPTAKSA